MTGRETQRHSFGRRLAAAAVLATLVLGGAPVVPAVADDVAVGSVGQDGVGIEGLAPGTQDGTATGAQGDAATGVRDGAIELEAQGASTQSVKYLEATWNASTQKVTYAEKSATCTEVGSGDTYWGEEGKASWYVASGNVGSETRVTCVGTVNLVLADGATLEIARGITVAEGNALNVYGQGGGTGKLVAGSGLRPNSLEPQADVFYYAGIGGLDDGDCFNGGEIAIHGGVIEATGGAWSAGIGGGGREYGAGGTVSVYGGTVNATGGERAAGIGGGDGGSGGTVSVYGGEVTATGGERAAGIGGGEYGSGGTVSVYGGEVTATGGERAAGIGGGYNAAGADVTITGGTVKATGSTYSQYEVHGIGAGLDARLVTDSDGSSGLDDGALTLGDAVVLVGGTSDSDATRLAVGSGDKYAGERRPYMETAGPATVTFHKNAGDATGTMGAQRVARGVATDLPANAFGRVGHTFRLWSTAADGSGATYGDKASVTTAADLALYAQWAANGYTVAFDANGGAGTMRSQGFVYGTAQKLATNAFRRDGHSFAGWNTARDGSGTAYANGQSVKNLCADAGGRVTLYAQWKADPKSTVTLRFANAELAVAFGAGKLTNELTNPAGITVTYASSNEKVATVDAASGEVTARGLGTTRITATFAGDATREKASASYALTVGLAKATGLKAVCRPGKSAVGVSWKKVKGAKYYRVQWTAVNGKKTTTKTKTVKGTKTTIGGAKDGARYSVRVRAVYDKRTAGEWSDVSRCWFRQVASASAKSSKKGKVTVSWSAATGANKGYRVLVRYAKNGKVAATKTVKAKRTSVTIKAKSKRKVWVSVVPLLGAKGKTYAGIARQANPIKVK